MVKPFLLRFAQPCMAPDRVPANPKYAYDEAIDMVRWLGSPNMLTVIEAYQNPDPPDEPDEPPVTKKCDIEKGEDQKDRRMWKRM